MQLSLNITPAKETCPPFPPFADKPAKNPCEGRHGALPGVVMFGRNHVSGSTDKKKGH